MFSGSPQAAETARSMAARVDSFAGRAEARTDPPRARLQRPALRALEVHQATQNDLHQGRVAFGERGQAVERPCPDELLRMLDVARQDLDDALALASGPG